MGNTMNIRDRIADDGSRRYDTPITRIVNESVMSDAPRESAWTSCADAFIPSRSSAFSSSTSPAPFSCFLSGDVSPGDPAKALEKAYSPSVSLF